MNYCKVEDIFKECESSGILTLWNFGLKPSQVEENILKTEQLMEISNEYLGYIKTDNSYEIIEEIVEDGSALVTFEVCTTVNEYKSIICDMIVAIFKARNYFISVENGKIVTVLSKSDFASSLYLSCDDNNICCSNSEYDSETESDHSENLTQCLPSTPPLNEECNPNIPWGEDSEHESVHETEQHKEKEHRSGHETEHNEKEHESDHDKEKEHESDHDNEKENESDHDNEKENESDHETEQHNEKEHKSDNETDQHNEPDSVKRIRLMGKYKSMKLVDLRFILQKRNIKKYGKKKVVIER